MDISNNSSQIKCKPFLRWAGGKTWLLKYIEQYLPIDGYNNYHEPFLGGGALFFHLQPEIAYLSDLNPELIETYNEVKYNVGKVIRELRKYSNTKEFYYHLREKHPKKAYKKAARFIYLNQTSFNGIFRVNLNGEYNVPYGFRKKDFFEPENLQLVTGTLKDKEIFHGDFIKVLNNLQERDLVFLDPPYTVTHSNNGFIKYNSKLFSEEDQKRLAKFLDEIHEHNAYYILTNASHKYVTDLFSKRNNRLVELQRASLIGGKQAKRGTYSELIITNIQ